MPLALIPLVALCALTAGSALFVRRSLARSGLPRPSAFCWLAVPALMLIASGINNSALSVHDHFPAYL